ncbi:hypothetical protein DSO57_1028487 [Entomophthora muscae]|uniref:Uncharacterized protein n=1 Tax=Entomophthora muscae TaxID=34485 RepID=A0ACC2RG50_9FUNG|nr:hypothetical protein DSO57_1028487 [Entomophthora muscae]
MPVPALTPPSPAGAPRYSWYPDRKANKEPTSSSGKKKKASKQASKNPSSPDNVSSPFSSDPQDGPEEYSKKFKASDHMAWDPLAIHNICLWTESSKSLSASPVFPIMSVKGSPGYIADNYIFNCNNQKRQTNSKHSF